MAASCSKAALLAPTASTLQLLVGRGTVGLNSTVTVTALVFESSGTPVHDGTLVSFFTTLGTLTPAQATTTNGQATVQLVTGTESGVAEITAVSGPAKLASTVKVNVGAAAVARVDLSASPLSLPSVGGQAVVTAIVSDASGNRLAGILVTFITTAGSFDAISVSTDGNGQAQVRLTTLLKATVTASAAGGTAGSVSSNSVAISTRTKPNAQLSVSATSLEVTAFYTAFEGADGAAVNSVVLNFGDGTQVTSLQAGSNQAVVHRYANPGTYSLLLTVTDVAGESAVALASISVVR